ncbi:GTP-binding protein [Desulfonauticus submarinus]|uniref:Large ribosomal subunit assembly factor BipA n=1 Tax=Desulfonauticus submarinus TaxID=206665 RepID=A0A1H0F3B0_9BACT|nr:translational GTPase TypA [Desulfonauticus submarinus]SDN89043.1 GTP-binding protein [Desulfonauticus submarinus]
MKSVGVNKKIRNIAIIAHVDHGKTTLVDSMLKLSGIFRQSEDVERVMDSLELERERGITIAAKNCALTYKGVKINILDTPGHADFGGEVERALSMVDGAILLVDASEGPLPQTRFVLQKALQSNLALILCINKIDRKDARPNEVLDEVYDLLIELDASEQQLDCPVLYTIGKTGVCKKSLSEEDQDLTLLFDAILEHIPAPSFDPSAPFQMLVSDLGYSDYLGRLAIGKVFNGRVKANETLVCIGEEKTVTLKVSKLQVYEGMEVNEVKEVEAGDIVVLSGIEEVKIGDTIATKANPKALPRIQVDEPTVSMLFSINTSPFAGREGKYVQSRKIRERLLKETLLNVAIRIEETEDKDAFIVKGRGEFQLAVLVETMRREGFELCVGRPKVIFKKEGDMLLEPMERVFIDCEEMFMGVVTEKLSLRKGRMQNLVNNGKGRVRLEFLIPSRGLIGYRDEFLTDTKGTGIMHSLYVGYGEYTGEIPSRFTGALVADREGVAVAYALFNLEPRGQLFVRPGDMVYEGMIIGEHNRANDLDVNPCKAKKLTNLRAAGKDDAVILTPVLPMTVERALHFIRDDEMVEVTPKSIRLRKVVLSAQKRHALASKAKKQILN